MEEIKSVLEKLGGNIEKRLKEIGMTRKTLAEKVGVSQNSISGYIRGKQLPKFDKLYYISIALETSLSELTGGVVYSLQTKEYVENAKKQAIKEYELVNAIEILEGIGFECYKKENGYWELYRQKTLDDFFQIIVEGAKVQHEHFLIDDFSLTVFSQTVTKTALETLKTDSKMQELNKKIFGCCC